MLARIVRRIVLLISLDAAARIVSGRNRRREGVASLLRGCRRALAHRSTAAIVLDATVGPAHRDLSRGLAQLRPTRRTGISRTRRVNLLAFAGAGGGLLVWSVGRQARRGRPSSDDSADAHAAPNGTEPVTLGPSPGAETTSS
jgi:hypothetical protein